jgi:uncharacterized membrane protein
MAQRSEQQPPEGMVEHHAFVSMNAPVHEVYEMFTHFTDFPKFMHFVKDVNYIDDQHNRTHWVADVIGQHEWDAVNENWVPDQQIGWRSVSGLQNEGKVTFQPEGGGQTRVDVYIDYNPPMGILGDIGEKLGAGSRFEHDLQQDLENFARMVNEAPPGALNPDASNYIFHPGSAAVEEGKAPPQANEANQTNQSSQMVEPGQPSTPDQVAPAPPAGMVGQITPPSPPAGAVPPPPPPPAPGQQTVAQQQTAQANPPSGSNATTVDNPYTMNQPATGVEQSSTSEQTMMGQPQEGYLSGQPVSGDDVVVEVYEIDTLPPEPGGTPVPDDTVETPPPNPINPVMPPEGTVYPMPQESGVENPVMPPPDGPAHPVMPPEQ